MDVNRIAESLSPLEKKILPCLKNNINVDVLTKECRLSETEVLRALKWLEDKKILSLNIESKEVINIDKNGLLYIEKGLPEKGFLLAVKDSIKTLNIIKKEAKLNEDEAKFSLGYLKNKGYIEILKDKEIKIKITQEGIRALKNDFINEEHLLKKLPKYLEELQQYEKDTIVDFKKRKYIIKIELEKIRIVHLTDFGINLLKTKIHEKDVIEKLTSDIIKNKEYKNKIFRRYNIHSRIPKIHTAKKQHYRKFLDEIRVKLLSLGFEEMFGPIVETEFWNMDALFMPQFHSARDIHDAYYIKEPKYSEVNKELVEKVKKVHEEKWKYNFDLKKTSKNILRTQGTSLSARIIASKELKIPGKYFAIARCFRHDIIDATHNCDFYQVEGIIVEENLNLRHLLGLLSMFAKEFANTTEIKLVPHYFPFTEPSVELHAKHKDLGWIELAGAGIFRPEVVKPLLGKDISVLAWGIGIDRIAMLKFGINDIRQLFSRDLEFLRTVKI